MKAQLMIRMSKEEKENLRLMATLQRHTMTSFILFLIDTEIKRQEEIYENPTR